MDSGGIGYWGQRPPLSDETLQSGDLELSGYQPNHPDIDPPAVPGYEEFPQIIMITDGAVVDEIHLKVYCMNDVPLDFDGDDGFTNLHMMEIIGSAAFTALVGDCLVLDVRRSDDAHSRVLPGRRRGRPRQRKEKPASGEDAGQSREESLGVTQIPAY